MKPSQIRVILDKNTDMEHFLQVLKDRFGSVPIHRVVMPDPFRRAFLSKFLNIANIAVGSLRLFLHFLLSDNRNCLFVTSSVTNTIAALLVRQALFLKNSVLITNWYLHGLESHPAVIRILSFLLDEKITILLQSPREKTLYKLRYPAIRTFFIPYCQAPVPHSGKPDAKQDYVFAGGYTNRDYETLISAAKASPYKFVIACSALNALPPVSPNVAVYRDIPREAFNRLMANAGVIVLNLRDQVGSSGQMVALAAMSMGKAIVYADNEGISYYFKGPDCAVPYTMRDARDLAAKIGVLMEDEQMRKRLGESARQRHSSLYDMRACVRYLRDALNAMIS
ncbi:MAG: glycosyltransferase [Desulfobacteraceae bacterium]|nr:glycosyltransferase [Desulfobacteraceae bacterium]